MSGDTGALFSGESLRLRLVIAAMFVLFTVSSLLAVRNNDVAHGFDELAHVSYVAALQAADGPVRLEELRMLDPASFHFTDKGNYINHAAPYYRALAVAGPRLEGNPGALVWYRLINVAIVLAGLGLLLATSLALARSTDEALVLLVTLFTIPVLAPLAGSVNNDNLAFLAGALTLFGSQRLLAERRSRDLALAGAGVVLAGIAKLTALMLCGGFLIVLLLIAWRDAMLRPRHLAVALVALAVGTLAPLDLWLAYGSPAPDTPAQSALLVDNSRLAGWAAEPRLGPFAYLAEFARSFIAGWKPVFDDRAAWHGVMLILPAIGLALAAAGVLIALRRLAGGARDPVAILVAAGAAAILATLLVHVGFSYRRHLATGWLMDAYPRYYLPLILIVPLATLILLRALDGGGRRIVAAFLLASPIAFALLG